MRSRNKFSIQDAQDALSDQTAQYEQEEHHHGTNTDTGRIRDKFI